MQNNLNFALQFTSTDCCCHNNNQIVYKYIVSVDQVFIFNFSTI